MVRLPQSPDLHSTEAIQGSTFTANIEQDRKSLWKNSGKFSQSPANYGTSQ